MKKRTRNIILITIGVLVSLFLYGRYNYDNDIKSFLEIKVIAGNEDFNLAFKKIEEINSFSNPLVNIAYQIWKNKMYARFITKEEVFENTSGNKTIQSISNIYREYWRTELLKDQVEKRTDTVLYKNIAHYLLSNKLTSLSKDSLVKTIKNNNELSIVLTKQGYKSKFLYRNGFQEVLIWDEETVNTYTVDLPKDTIKTTVIFIENYHLNGYDNYATFGSSNIGGWADKEKGTLYCNKASYDLNSEYFNVSFLKHESLHSTDLNNYPNLSGTDLEYRSKLIELMYCTEKTIYDRIAQFLNGASSTERTHTHPYANYCVIKDFSKLLFNSEYESDFEKWKKISVEKINNAAIQLYNLSEDKLSKNKNVNEII